jgi:hypothetical protein|tara:strand:+ start:3198 stop:3464 length:267 start_codon:yes stop_codon:yes gene_type:complete
MSYRDYFTKEKSTMSMMTQFKNWMAGLMGREKNQEVVENLPQKVQKVKQARDARGRFLKDDPTTEENEAFVSETERYHGKGNNRIERP